MIQKHKNFTMKYQFHFNMILVYFTKKIHCTCLEEIAKPDGISKKLHQ